MRIACCYCGARGNEEFAYLGDATVVRPDADPSLPLDEAARQRWHDYVYLRDNPAGPHRELWQHVCRLPGLAGGDARHPHARDPAGRAGARCGARRVRARSHDRPAADCSQASPPPCGEGSGGGVQARSAAGFPPSLAPPHKAEGTSRSRRLPSGGLIDRSQALTFSFDGRSYRGHPGDTLASALLANGVHLVGRSFKYHRPRGILTAGPEEPNALVELRAGARREPNTRATTAELYDGLVAASQNRWPSLRFDLLAVNSLIAPVLSAGFYYKTFMWPASFWEKVYEPLIRRAAGLGRASGAGGPGHLREGLPALRRAGHRRRAGGPDGGAGGRAGPARASCCATRISASAGG